MRARLAFALVPLLLAACDGGHRERPGSDNLNRGPSLRISSPAAEQVLTTREPVVMFDVEGVSFDGTGNSLQVIVDDRPASSWPNATRPYPLGPLDPGAHLVRAFVVKKDGRAYENTGAFVVQRFHVERAQPDAFNPKAPMVTVAGPAGQVARGAEAAVANVRASGVTLGEGGNRLRVVLTGPGMPPLTAEKTTPAASVPLSGLPPGAYKVSADIVGADGKPLAGPMARAERTFEVR